MSETKPLGVVEFFWLSGAQRASEKLSESARDDLKQRLGLAHQRAEAAEALWMNGHTAEGLRLAKEAFEATLDVVVPFGESSGIPIADTEADKAREEKADEEKASDGEEKAGAGDEEKADEEKVDAGDEEKAAEEKASDGEEKADEEKASDGEEKADEEKADEEKADEEKADEEKADEEKASDGEEKAEAGDEEQADEEEAEASAEEQADEEKAEAGGEAKPGDGEEKADEEKADAGGEEKAGDGGEKASDGEAKAGEEKADAAGAAGASGAPSSTPDAGDPADRAVRQVLAARHLGSSKIDDVLTARRALASASLPEWDQDVDPSHHELFQRLSTARRNVAKALDPAVMTKGERRWIRFTRVGTVAVLAIAGLIGSYFTFHTPEGIIATASSNWSPHQHLPQEAIDGNPNTEWHCHDNQTGWLEVSIEPPQDIQTLRVLNGHNPGHNDRAMRDATIEVYSDGEVVHSFTHNWPRIEPEPEWVELEVGAEDVDRIRVVISRFHFHGAAIAEIEWE